LADEILTQHDHAFGQEILRCEVGSTAHGTGVSEQDDLDLMAVVVPPKEQVYGLFPFDNHIYRTATIRTGKHNEKSLPGDVDLTFYSLRKFVGLCRKGNPSILNALYGPTTYTTALGDELRASKDMFRSKEAGHRFIGYMHSQRKRMEGERGQKGVNRPELVEKYGFDTKYAYHIIRLGLQGLEYMKNGKISVPMNEVYRELLVGIRTGSYTFEQVLQWADELKAELDQAVTDSDWPEQAPAEPIDALLIALHEDAWEQARRTNGVDTQQNPMLEFGS
jgi:predicted nucleotidyltransferase